jgi:transcription initiation factor TFIID TATA-box-binding protein
MKVEIVNVVASASLGHSIDLKAVSNALPYNAFYRQNDFSRLKRIAWKFKNATIMIFESGHILCLGAKGSDQAKRLIKKAIEVLNANGLIINNNNLKVKIVNLIARVNLGFKVDLEKLALKLEKCIYEPEQFPALIYKANDGVSFLIFSTGEISALGLKNEDNAKKAIEKLVKLIDEEGGIQK